MSIDQERMNSMANMEENKKKMKKKDQAAEREGTDTPVFDQQKFLDRKSVV